MSRGVKRRPASEAVDATAVIHDDEWPVDDIAPVPAHLDTLQRREMAALRRLVERLAVGLEEVSDGLADANGSIGELRNDQQELKDGLYGEQKPGRRRGVFERLDTLELDGGRAAKVFWIVFTALTSGSIGAIIATAIAAKKAG